MPDVARIGGVSGWMQAAGVAAAHGVADELAPDAGGQRAPAGRHADRHWLEYVDWADALVQEPLKIVDGHAVIPDRPGSGIAWDAAAVAKYQLG